MARSAILDPRSSILDPQSSIFDPHLLLSHSPDLPPLFLSNLISPITIPRSMALSMSYKVNAATETAVKASISTPVCALVEAVAVILAPFSSSVICTSA